MRKLLSVILLLLVATAATAKSVPRGRSAAAGRIDHFVVLMLENRAFDHMCGWLKRKNPEINGLTGNEFNEYKGKKYYVNDTCPYVNPFDPNHDLQNTTMQIMGNANWWINPAPMNGFVAELLSGVPGATEANAGEVMNGFSPERVPAISTLAEEFAVFDSYYASLPGPTTPNRVFFNAGSSDGVVSDNNFIIALGYKGKTMFDIVEENGLTWKAYFEDISDLLYLQNLRNLSALAHYDVWDGFKSDAANGTLPHYSWISPRFYSDFGHHPRDQHPDHDVVEGERAIAEVYQALRNGKNWNRTALFITYDEHGGIYDHVSPPDPVPNPDGINAWDIDYPFNFTRAGLRVCSLLVSPWVKKGTVVHGPNMSSPLERISNFIDEPTAEPSAYEHTSIFKTLRNLWGLPNAPLSKRQAWAAPYDWVLGTQDAPRTDCPTSVPVPPVHSEKRFKMIHNIIRKKRPNGLQRGFYRMIESLYGRDGSDEGRFTTQEAMGEYVQEMQRQFLSKARKSHHGHKHPHHARHPKMEVEENAQRHGRLGESHHHAGDKKDKKHHVHQ